MSVVTQPAPSTGRFQWTIYTFYRAMEAGVFDEPKKMELISGELWTKEIVNPPHAFVTNRIARRFRTAFEPRFFVREEKPVHLAIDSEPLPDVCVVVVDAEDYFNQHPTQADALLIVEVADTTVARDMGEKALLYAQAGIPDYWVSLVNERELIVFRGPTLSGYTQQSRLTENDVVRPLAAPDVEFNVRDLIAQTNDVQGTS